MPITHTKRRGMAAGAGRDRAATTTWFGEEFGVEEPNTFAATRALFALSTNHYTLLSKANQRTFYVGPFELLSVAELRVLAAGKKEIAVLSCSHDDSSGGGGGGGGLGDDASGGLGGDASVKQSHDKTSTTTPEASSPAVSATPSSAQTGLVFSCIEDDVRTLHRRRANRNAVFQVASQFNCLEMVGPGSTPEDGITCYADDKTQGPACCLACPAATVYRNYFWRGRGQCGGSNRQINTVSDVEALLGNAEHEYWSIKNGYMIPTRREAMTEVGQRLRKEHTQEAVAAEGAWADSTLAEAQALVDEAAAAQEAEAEDKENATRRQTAGQTAGQPSVTETARVVDDSREMINIADADAADAAAAAAAAAAASDESTWAPLREKVVSAVRVGVHWDTQVAMRDRSITADTSDLAAQRVTQVFCSGCPVSYTKRLATTAQWAPLARAVLDAAFEATLAVAVARSRAMGGVRVRVFLTCVGGGAFGNPSLWVAKALERALGRFSNAPLDVFLVFYRRTPPQAFRTLSRRYGSQR